MAGVAKSVDDVVTITKGGAARAAQNIQVNGKIQVYKQQLANLPQKQKEWLVVKKQYTLIQILEYRWFKIMLGTILEFKIQVFRESVHT